ncbi:MAG TPA: ATP-binding cassette domain-containing protein [Streptosporangiaceae bacterium]|nr:ATP-binding cassette domain-containing protein [Streptosporangiaceae bacterium]
MTGILAGWGGQLTVLLNRITETGPDPEAPSRPGQAEPRSHDLRITGLRFASGLHAEPVIDDLTVVGPSGIGKSTRASLIVGWPHPRKAGSCWAAFHSGRSASPTLRSTIALIPREAYVFTGTLRLHRNPAGNLGYLRPQASAAALEEAVEALGMLPLVDRLGGFDTRLGVGGPVLSAGERQLIALA